MTWYRVPIHIVLDDEYDTVQADSPEQARRKVQALSDETYQGTVTVGEPRERPTPSWVTQ
jgi:hypothetical protein